MCLDLVIKDHPPSEVGCIISAMGDSLSWHDGQPQAIKPRHQLLQGIPGDAPGLPLDVWL